MTHSISTALATGDLDSVLSTLTGQLGPVASPRLVLLFSSPKLPLGALASALSSRLGAPVAGASTAGELTEQGVTKGGVSAIAIGGDLEARVAMGRGLAADPEKAVSDALSSLPASLEGHPHRTAILLLDPLSGRGEEAALLCGALLGEDVLLAGGAAGDDLAMSKTVVSAGGEGESDAVVVVMLYTRRPLAIGVCHGHKALSDKLTVTRAEGNVVHEIDGRPAWQVWLEHTREHAGLDGPPPRDAEGAFLLRYEAGLDAGDGLKVRAPLSRDDAGAIQFACGIPTGSVIRITESTASRQVDSAREAARRARERLGAEASGAIVFDCICRNLILGDAFRDAVAAISSELGGAPLAGFETYGEIALSPGEMSGFHNTTTVVLAFPR